MNERITVRVDPRHIDMLNRIFEGYDGIGIVSTLDRKEGLVVIRVTPDTYHEAMQILAAAPFDYTLTDCGD